MGSYPSPSTLPFFSYFHTGRVRPSSFDLCCVSVQRGFNLPRLPSTAFPCNEEGFIPPALEIDGLDEVHPVDFRTVGFIELHDILIKPLPAGCRLTVARKGTG